MKQFSGFEAKKVSTREVLPAGGYVVKILDVQEITYSWGNVLEISFDVVEGDYAGFFKKDYAGQIQEDKKWRGKYRLSIPNDDGSDKDAWTKRTFGGAIFAVEDSNPKFRWTWDEKALKGLIVGTLFRNKEWEMNGNSGWTTECSAFISADDVRSGNFKIPKDKALKKEAKPAQSVADFEDITDDDSGYPF